MNNKSDLLSPFQLGPELTLKNRIIMAPMTRAKAAAGNLPTPKMTEYYARRANAGLIITEGTIISPEASGYPDVPGIYNEKQIAAWRNVTDAVHSDGGLIFLQLWHVGRVSHPSFLNGQLPISASATQMSGKVRRSKDLYYGQSRAATIDEIKDIINKFTLSARDALEAGFDGVELHGANGYLLDQFLHYNTNHRKDEYGATPENMCRFPLEVLTSVGNAIGYNKVGIRLSPGAYLNEIVGDKRDKDVFEHLLNTLNNFPIAYVHTGNFDDKVKFEELEQLTMTAFIRKHYKGNLIASGSYTLEEAEKRITNEEFDLIAIGRPFIANPNLITQFKNHEKLTAYESKMLGDLY